MVPERLALLMLNAEAAEAGEHARFGADAGAIPHPRSRRGCSARCFLYPSAPGWPGRRAWRSVGALQMKKALSVVLPSRPVAALRVNTSRSTRMTVGNVELPRCAGEIIDRGRRTLTVRRSSRLRPRVRLRSTVSGLLAEAISRAVLEQGALVVFDLDDQSDFGFGCAFEQFF